MLLLLTWLERRGEKVWSQNSKSGSGRSRVLILYAGMPCDQLIIIFSSGALNLWFDIGLQEAVGHRLEECDLYAGKM